MGVRAAACILVAGTALGACKFVPTAEVKAIDAKGVGADAAFDPDKEVAALWDAKVIPYLTGKAGDLAEVRALVRKNPDEAGSKYGYRPATEGAPWIVVVRFEGKVLAANTESRAATLDVDVDGDGKPDATVQIGPAIRGTALRDALSFVSFNSFTNQIDFARFGKAFNTHVDRTVLSELPRDNLVGKTVTVLGTAPLGDSGQPLLVTPAAIAIDGKS